MGKRVISRKRFFSLILSGFVLVLLFHYQTFLTGAGRFLSPQGIGNADVVVVEGTEVIGDDAIKSGLKLLSSRNAQRLVVVYQKPERKRIFGWPSNYSPFLIRELEEVGLRKDQIIVLEVPEEHPVTITEAKVVLSNLSKSGVRRVILVTEGFHTRRSLWAYKEVGSSLGIEIIPYPYFTRYQSENWWQEIYGTKDFFEESLKLFYYLLRGYIPIKSLFVS
jgi:uncharacterized SAM-binding protein YcdF (DUF218 family)